MMIHLHRWENLVDVGTYGSSGNLVMNRHYRHCSKCDKWQRYFGSWGENWWEDSDKPDGAESLIPEAMADKMFKNERMRENARR